MEQILYSVLSANYSNQLSSTEMKEYRFAYDQVYKLCVVIHQYCSR